MGLKIENQNESCLGRADDDDGAGCLRLVHTQVGRSSESRQPKSQSSPVRTPEGGRERAFEKLFNETDSGGGAGWAYISEVDERNIRVPGGVRSIFYTIQIPHTVFPPLQVGLETHETLTVGGRRKTGLLLRLGAGFSSTGKLPATRQTFQISSGFGCRLDLDRRPCT